MSVFQQSSAERKLRVAARQSETALPASLPPVFWMTDPDRTSDLLKTSANLPRNWGMIYRHFGHKDRLKVASALARLSKQRGFQFLIANDPMLAKHIGADGVHWPHSARQKAKYWRSAFKLMTVSAHSPQEVRRVSAEIFDAVIVSTVFDSSSPSAGVALGAHKFRQICKTSPLPCYGLGGIGLDTAHSIAPHAGLAMVSAIDTVFGN